MAKRLRVGVVFPVGEVDPHLGVDHGSGLVQRQVFESLYRRSDGRAVPDLFARELRVVEGGYEARLREGVCFSDGSPLTAELVCESLRRCPALSSEVECSHEGSTLRLSGELGLAELRDVLSSPVSAIMKAGADGALGTGPFAVVAREGEVLSLGCNPHHAGFKPSIEGVDVIPFHDHLNLAHAIASGDIDFTTMLAPGELPKGSFVRTSYLQTPSTALLWVNVERVLDARVRRAIAHGLDRARLLRLSYPGIAGLNAASVVPRSLGQVPDQLRFDPDEARQLLDEAGGSSPRVLRMCTIWGARPYLPDPVACAEDIAAQLEPLGIEVKVERAAGPLEWKHALAAGDFELALGGWYADEPSQAFFLSAVYGSESVPRVGVDAVMGSNFARFCDPKVDGLLARLRSTGEDVLDELGSHLRREAPVVALHHGAMTAALGSRIRGREFDELSFPVFSCFTLSDL
ncbi:ABC transporter substrate-binding protein [Enhygromyxa salina]|uniref:ABC transporter substrate-binding protein n=1 Tax=Enhygromyxa salina TaxID=215803 RepID=UPI0011B23078|nr:ABC transporter substrate-binding protein [Enhygromyxa salina]